MVNSIFKLCKNEPVTVMISKLQMLLQFSTDEISMLQVTLEIYINLHTKASVTSEISTVLRTRKGGGVENVTPTNLFGLNYQKLHHRVRMGNTCQLFRYFLTDPAKKLRIHSTHYIQNSPGPVHHFQWIE